ncbi:MAG: type II toxin-antitoxin system YoeB family toxin [Acidobacteriota bacterium]|nr:type II toxin-antitoxin system YoeB family toxin [Acidobacteriota bacterium]
MQREPFKGIGKPEPLRSCLETPEISCFYDIIVVF